MKIDSKIRWLKTLPIFYLLGGVRSQLEFMSNVGNIVMEQDPRQQDPFYRNYYARAEGMPLAAVNSVVHNVKHQSEGQFNLWHELPSHRVRPGYTTTTKRPKITTTTVPWVRGRHRPQLGHQQAPWYQKYSDPDGYDTEQGTDYEDAAPSPPRPRGRRPPGGRGRRPPAPTAPVRIQMGKNDELVENVEGEGADEGTRADSDSEGMAKPEEGKKVVATTEKPKVTSKTTRKPEKKKQNDDEGMMKIAFDDEGTKKEGASEDEGGKHGEIDLAELKNGGVIHHLRTSGKGKETKNGEEEEEDSDDESLKSKTKKKGKKKGEKEEEEEDGDKKKSKKKKGKKIDEEKNKKKSKKQESDEEDDDNEEGGELKRIDGDVRIQKAVDGDTNGHDDETEEDDDEEEDSEDKEDHSRHGKKGRKSKKNHEEDEEDSEDYDEDGEEDDEEESKENRKLKKTKLSCPPTQRHQNPPHQPSHQHHPQNPPNQVPYPDDYGYTHPTSTTTTTMRTADDYQQFENTDCKERKEDEEEKEEEDGESEEKKKKKRKRSKKNRKKKKSKKGKSGKRHHVSLDYLTSREKIDQSRRNRGHILDELHADQDLKKLRKNSKPPDSGIECSKAVDEFPLKCGAWKTAGFCDTNQATQFLWCRKTCLCSHMLPTTTASKPNSDEFKLDFQ